MESVQIQNRDMAWHIAANILFPPNFNATKSWPAIIAVHPFGSCKEQTSGNVYGKALAEQGFVVIAYDASFQGASGGEPRWIEDPTQRVEDISHVIDYAVTLPYVDTDRIGVIGVCGGGGYVLNATLTEKRIKAVVAITMTMRAGDSKFDGSGASVTGVMITPPMEVKCMETMPSIRRLAAEPSRFGPRRPGPTNANPGTENSTARRMALQTRLTSQWISPGNSIAVMPTKCIVETPRPKRMPAMTKARRPVSEEATATARKVVVTEIARDNSVRDGS